MKQHVGLIHFEYPNVISGHPDLRNKATPLGWTNGLFHISLKLHHIQVTGPLELKVLALDLDLESIM